MCVTSPTLAGNLITVLWLWRHAAVVVVLWCRRLLLLRRRLLVRMNRRRRSKKQRLLKKRKCLLLAYRLALAIALALLCLLFQSFFSIVFLTVFLTDDRSLIIDDVQSMTRIHGTDFSPMSCESQTKYISHNTRIRLIISFTQWTQS